MMQFTTMTDKDFSGGIDQNSAENAIPETFVEQLDNGIAIEDGFIMKRPGYITYGGGLPFRVKYIRALSPNKLCLYLDSAIALTTIHPAPLLVVGRVSASGFGDLTTTDSKQYYVEFTADPRQAVPPGGSTTLTTDGQEVGLESSNIIFGSSISTSSVTESNYLFIPDSISIAPDLTISEVVTNSTPSVLSVFSYWINCDDNSGFRAVATGQSGFTWTVPAATHQLPNSNIIVQAYQDTTGTFTVIEPDAVKIGIDGSVTCEFSSSVDGKLCLSACPLENSITGTVPPSSTMTTTIPNPRTSFSFVECYLEQGPYKERVLPESITYNEATDEITVVFINSSAMSKTFYVYWDSTNVISNKLCIDSVAGVTTGRDDNPQLCVYGIDHENNYTSGTRSGWVQHLDSYKSVLEEKLVAGIGQNLYAITEYTGSAAIDAANKLPKWWVNKRGNVNGQANVGPLFQQTSSTFNRTDGYIRFNEAAADGTAIIESIRYVNTNTVACEIPATGVVQIGVFTGKFLNLTISQARYEVFNGVHLIKQLTVAPGKIVIQLTMPEIINEDFDCTGSVGICGIFTSSLTMSNTATFILPGDTVICDAFPDRMPITCVSHQGSASFFTRLVIEGTTENVVVPSAVQVLGKSSDKYCITLRDGSGALPSSAGTDVKIVAGDMISLNGTAHEIRVKNVMPAESGGGSFCSGNGTTAQIGSFLDTSMYKIGDRIVIVNGVFAGEHVLTEVTATVLKFAHPYVGSSTTEIMWQRTIELDEALPELEDTSNNTAFFTVSRRWYPIEVTTQASSRPKKNYVGHFIANDVTEQPSLRSTLLSNCMYFTNGDDFIYKYDGANLIRAGFPRWSMLQDLTSRSGVSAKITMPNPTVSSVSHTTTQITLEKGIGSFFITGAKIQIGTETASRTIIGINTAKTANDYLETTTGATTSGSPATIILRTAQYRYYFRLNYVDINNNLITSAMIDSEDARIEIIKDSAIHIKLCIPPVLDCYDYDRMEIEVYRTKANSVSPYYRVQNAKIDFDTGCQYAMVLDTTDDDDLRVIDPIQVLTGDFLATGIQEPPRAKFITTADNRLVLANIKSPKRIDIQVLKNIKDSSVSDLVTPQRKITLRRDETSTATVTDNIDNYVFEFVDPTPVAITGITVNATSFTVTSAAHGLAVGDWVYITRTSITDPTNFNTRYCNWWRINSKDTNTFTVLCNDIYTFDAAAWASATDANVFIKATNTKDIPIFLGTDLSNGFEFGNTNSGGVPSPLILHVRRAAMAINAVMAVSTSPFAVANGSADYPNGFLRIEFPVHLDTNPGLKLSAFPSTYLSVFANGVRRSAGETVSAISELFPSRVVYSFKNYPEMFYNCYTANDVNSIGVIDVNPSDGQQITGIIPFFGEAAFGAAQKSGIILVFKERSIYIIDLIAKEAGSSIYIQKLYTNGIGCTYPYSIAQTKTGIMFANESGIYKVGTDLTVQYVGNKMERLWLNEIDKTDTGKELAQGHHYPQTRQYKLSLPVIDATENSQVYAYNHTRESAQQAVMGSWSRYTNHPATIWANQRDMEYFGSTKGRVFQGRNTGTAADFRDDASPVQFTCSFRAMGFGDNAVRKKCLHIFLSMRAGTSVLTGTQLFSALDLNNTFRAADLFSLGTLDKKVDTIRFNLDGSRFQYLQIKVTNGTIDEPVEITSIDYRVSGLSSKGTTEAISTRG